MIRDSLRFLGKLTLRKITNLILIRASYLISLILRRPLVWGRPCFISIEPASICNLECPQCPAGMRDIHRDNKFLEDQFFSGIIDELAGTTLILNLNFQGEPLMRNNFHEWIRYAHGMGLYTMTSTNGQMLFGEIPSKLIESGLDRIIISVDGTDQKTYGAYRKKGSLEAVIKGIGELSAAREKAGTGVPYIIIQFLLLRHNQHQIADIKRLGKEWGADRVVLKSAQIEYPGTGKDWLPEEIKYSRYIQGADGEITVKNNIRNRCRRLWETTVVTTDALIVPCCFDKRSAYPMGSLSDSEFKSIWKNEKYNGFRKQVLRNRKEVSICLNCCEGLNNVYIR